MNRATELTTLIAAVAAAALAAFALATRPPEPTVSPSTDALEAKLDEIAALLRTIADAPAPRADDEERLAPVAQRRPARANDEALRDAIERLSEAVESIELGRSSVGREVVGATPPSKALARMRERSGPVSEQAIRDLHALWAEGDRDAVPLEYSTYGLHDWIETIGWPEEYYVPSTPGGRFRLQYSKGTRELGFEKLEIYCDAFLTYLVIFDLP